MNLESRCRKLDSRIKEIRDHFMYDSNVARRVLLTLNQDALAHSDALEPDCDSIDTLDKLKKAYKKAKSKFTGDITAEFLKDLAYEIDNNNFGFRRGQVGIIGASGTRYLMTNPAKIQREIQRLTFGIKNSNEHDLVKACQLNLYGLIIHPFKDGNGRTFRLAQNMYLEHNGLPPVVIRKNERPTYLRTIERALIGFRERGGQEEMFKQPSTGEMDFFHFCIDKVEGGVEDVGKRISSFGRYKIEMYVQGNGNRIRSIRRNIQRRFQAQGWVTQTKVDVCNKSIELTTEAPRDAITGAMEHYQKNFRWLKHYDIN